MKSEYIDAFRDAFTESARVVFDIEFSSHDADMVQVDDLGWVQADYDAAVVYPFNGEVFGDLTMLIRQENWTQPLSRYVQEGVPFESCLTAFANTVGSLAIAKIVRDFPNVSASAPKIVLGKVLYSSVAIQFKSLRNSLVQFTHLGLCMDTMSQRMKEQLERASEQNAKIIELMERLKATQHELLEAAHTEGMTEIAASVVHDIGGLMNSITINVDTILGVDGGSVIGTLTRLVRRIEESPHEYRDFSQAPQAKGPTLLTAVGLLSSEFNSERERRRHLIADLLVKLEHAFISLRSLQSYVGPRTLSLPLSVNRTIRDVVHVLEPDIVRAQATVNFDGDIATVGELILPKNRFINVIVNLIRNAVEAVAECPEAQRHVYVYAKWLNGELTVQVSDKGLGFAVEDKERLFSHGYTTKKGGKGLGLHLSANAAVEMGGRLEAFSAGVGNGAVFTLVVPTRRADEVRSA